MPLSVHKINLTYFRNYETLRLEPAGARIVVLTGENGAGKTNILEAVSLLSPGRGLRGARLEEMRHRDATGFDSWAIAAELETARGEKVKIGTGLAPAKNSVLAPAKNNTFAPAKNSSPASAKKDAEGKRRIIRIDGKDAKGQSELAGLIAAVWLTPQMDRIFLEGAGVRRKFLDRLVFAFEPAQATHLNRYEKTLRARMKLLQGDASADARWLDQLELQLAADGVMIAAARRNLIDHLQHHVLNDGSFPAPRFELHGWLDNSLASRPAVTIEEELKDRLKKSRGLDAAAGKSQEGPHRSDFNVIYAEKNMPAAQCSTGEQKGLLISTVLAHARMMQAEKGFVPLLLLDEVAAHLDDARRRALFEYLASFETQVWLTGTEASIFSGFRSRTVFYDVQNGHAAAARQREAG